MPGPFGRALQKLKMAIRATTGLEFDEWHSSHMPCHAEILS